MKTAALMPFPLLAVKATPGLVTFFVLTVAKGSIIPPVQPQDPGGMEGSGVSGFVFCSGVSVSRLMQGKGQHGAHSGGKKVI